MNLMKAVEHNGSALGFDPHKGEAVQVTKLQQNLKWSGHGCDRAFRSSGTHETY